MGFAQTRINTIINIIELMDRTQCARGRHHLVGYRPQRRLCEGRRLGSSILRRVQWLPLGCCPILQYLRMACSVTCCKAWKHNTVLLRFSETARGELLICTHPRPCLGVS